MSFRVNVLSKISEAKLLVSTDTFVTSAINVMLPLFVTGGREERREGGTVGERDEERGTERERDVERKRDGEREREGQRERERERDRERQRETERDREGQRGT